MKAVVCTPGGTRVDDVPDPEPRDGEAVVQVEACGLCGSDVHSIERGQTQAGQILGHELAGRVVDAGSTGWRVGAAVAVNPLGSCGGCRACARRVPFGCHVPNIGINAPGGYAQYVAVPGAQLVALPDGVPVELGACAEPLAVALNAVRLADVGPGDTALVYGVGSIGLNVIMALRLSGVDSILAAGRSPGRRAAAARVGASEVVDTRATAVTGSFTAVFECSGAPGAVAALLALLEPGGTCVEVALSDEVVAVSVAGLVAGGLRLAGSCAFDPTAYLAAVDHITSGRAPVTDIISERVGIDDTPDMLVRLRTPGELVRVLAKPWA